MADMNDQLKGSQEIAVIGTLVLILAAGMVLGPTLGGLSVERAAPAGIFYLLIIIATLTAMTALFRLWRIPSEAVSRGFAVTVSENLTPEATTLHPKASEHGHDKLFAVSAFDKR